MTYVPVARHRDICASNVGICRIDLFSSFSSLACNTFQMLHSIHGARWSVANRLHRQRTGDFSWRPVLRYQEDRPFPARPYPELRPCKVITSQSGSATASPDMRPFPGFVPHAYHPTYQPRPCLTTPTAQNVNNSSAFHIRL